MIKRTFYDNKAINCKEYIFGTELSRIPINAINSKSKDFPKQIVTIVISVYGVQIRHEYRKNKDGSTYVVDNMEPNKDDVKYVLNGEIYQFADMSTELCVSIGSEYNDYSIIDLDIVDYAINRMENSVYDPVFFDYRIKLDPVCIRIKDADSILSGDIMDIFTNNGYIEDEQLNELVKELY